MHHGLQRSQGGVGACRNALGCGAGVHLGAELTGVYVVFVEMVALLPAAVLVELGGRYLVEVYVGHALLAAYLLEPLALLLAHNLAVLAVGVVQFFCAVDKPEAVGKEVLTFLQRFKQTHEVFPGERSTGVELDVDGRRRGCTLSAP